MSLLVKFSILDPVKKEVWMRAHFVMSVERDSRNPLLTQIQTSIQTQQGSFIMTSMDTPDNIAEMVNNALIACPDPTSN